MFTIDQAKRRRARGENNQLLKERAGGAGEDNGALGEGEQAAGTWVQRTPVSRDQHEVC